MDNIPELTDSVQVDTHTAGCSRARSGCWGAPGRWRPHTSTARCWCGTAWTGRIRVRHTEGRTDRRPAEDGRKTRNWSRRWKTGRSLCDAHTASSLALQTNNSRVRRRQHQQYTSRHGFLKWAQFWFKHLRF